MNVNGHQQHQQQHVQHQQQNKRLSANHNNPNGATHQKTRSRVLPRSLKNKKLPPKPTKSPKKRKQPMNGGGNGMNTGNMNGGNAMNGANGGGVNGGYGGNVANNGVNNMAMNNGYNGMMHPMNGAPTMNYHGAPNMNNMNNMNYNSG